MVGGLRKEVEFSLQNLLWILIEAQSPPAGCRHKKVAGQEIQKRCS